MKTLKSKVIVQGHGLMTNTNTVFEILPSNTKGIRFHIAGDTIEAKLDNVVSTDHCVVLADVKNGAKNKVMLVEHFMATCSLLGIDALDINIKEGFETPILDGSAKVWAEKFKEVGFNGEEDEIRPLNEPVIYQAKASSIILIPSDKTTITYSVNFNHPELKQRWVMFEDNIEEVIEARTFGYLKDLETFQKMGFARGVTPENTVGLTDTGFTT